MRRYYFPIFHNGETQADEVGELFASAELAVQYGARVARDIASDPDCDRGAGTVVIVLEGRAEAMEVEVVNEISPLSCDPLDSEGEFHG